MCVCLQYDSQVEEAFITRAVQEREASSVRKQQPDLSESAPASTSTTSSPTEATAEIIEPSTCHSTDPVQNPAPPVDVNNQRGQARSVFGLNNASSILTPTPIGATLVGAKGGASDSALRNIDLKDFEREQDPFENLSLRVINDREELNKVFHVTSPPSQHHLSATVATSAPSASGKPEHAANTPSSSFLQYGSINVANGLNTAGLNWVTCQPVPRWPVANHNMSNTCGSAVRPQHPPYVGRVSGPFADHANFPMPGTTSYFRSPNFQSPQQPPTTSMLRSAKSTPDISSLLDDHTVASARRTPPPVFSDRSTIVDFQNRVRHIFNIFVFRRIYFKYVGTREHLPSVERQSKHPSVILQVIFNLFSDFLYIVVFTENLFLVRNG